MTTTLIDRLAGINEGVAIKAPCRVATTANISLTGLQTIDGYVLAEGDRVLVKDQTSQVDNGIYKASASPWSRDLDCDGTRDIVHGTIVFISNGSVNGGLFFQCTTADPITIGTTALVWAQTLASPEVAANPLRGLHYDDYYLVYNDHDLAFAAAIHDLYNSSSYDTLHGDGRLVILKNPCNVASAAGLSGATFATPKRITGFKFQCDPTWPQPSFAQTFTGIIDRTSATITGISDTSALVVGQMIEHKYIPRFSTIASKTSSTITLTNQWWSTNPTVTAGLVMTGNTTSGSNIVTTLSSINTRLSPGLSVTGTGIPGGTTVGQAVLTFTLSNAATATTAGLSVKIATLTGTGTVVYTATADITNTSTSITVYCDDSRVIVNGMTITGTGIPANTTLSSRSAFSVRLTANATATNTGVSLTFGTAPTDFRALNYVTGDTTADSRVVTSASSTAPLSAGQVIDGVAILRCNAIQTVDSSTQFSLARPAWATASGKVFNYRNDSYLLDFSGFASLTYLTIDGCTFDGNDVGNGIRMAANQLPCSVHHNWFLNHVYFGVRNWSKDSGGFTCERNRFFGSNIAYNGNDSTRLATHITTSGSDGKILFNQGQGFLHGIVVADSAFAIGNHFFNSGTAPVYLQQNNGRCHWLQNYMDTGSLELSNEGNAGNSDFSIGNANIVGNFLKTGQAPTIAYIKARPCVASTPLAHINIIGNLVRQTAGNNSATYASLTGVDTTNGDLDYTNFTAVNARDNVGPGLIGHENPLRVRKNVSVGATSHTIDLTNLMPFNGQPNYLVGGVGLMNATTPCAVTNVTLVRSTRVVTIATASSTTGDLCFEVNANVQASPTQAAATSTFMDAQ